MSILTFSQKVFELTKNIPRGKVTTYGEIARALNKPKAGRAVGSVLNKNINPAVPCHRVIKSNGYAGGYIKGASQKTLILRKEGVRVNKHGIIDLRKYQHKQYF